MHNFILAAVWAGGVKYHAEDRFTDRRAVDPYISGVDVFSIHGKFLLYFCAVVSRTLGGDSVAYRREV
jgi:hypothetical protein